LLRNGDLRIKVFAEGKGPLIVMLPSARRGQEDFDEAAEGLAAAGFRVLRPEPRGIGLSSKGPLKGITLHDLADDTAAVIRHENAGPAVLVGHAFGHYVARMAAVDHPDLVRGVVLAAAASKTVAPEVSVVFRKAIDLTLPEKERIEAIAFCFFAPGHDASIWSGGWSTDAADVQGEAIRNTQREEWWGAGSAPVLDLRAEYDPFRPASSHEENRTDLGAHRVLPVMIPNASHGLFCEQPKAVVDAIVPWTKALPR
jgi:pimeloyl-ACP methyl ester carboxylesterase